MSNVDGRRKRIDRLVAENEELAAIMRRWQENGEVTEVELHTTRRRYIDWYTRAKKEISKDQHERFVDMYEGGEFVTRIRGYLQNPLQPSVLHDPANPMFPKWQVEFSQTPNASLGIQRDILLEALHDGSDISDTLEELDFMFRRLPEFLEKLRAYGYPNVPAPNLKVEKDLQALVHALLVMHYADVREEDFVPEYAGAGSRVDFLLREVGIVVETKMTRPGLEDRKVGEELLIDWGRYSKHPDCRGIFALVYDPTRLIKNPSGLEYDLSGVRYESILTRVVVAR